MTKVVTVYEAKTHLSELIKKAAAGETIYVGAFGKAQAVIAPLPKKNKKINLGVCEGKHKGFDFESEALVGSDEDLLHDFEESINKPL